MLCFAKETEIKQSSSNYKPKCLTVIFLFSFSFHQREQTEDIYENCLEAAVQERRGYNQPYHYKFRAH